MKMSVGGEWIHLLCAIHIPELGLLQGGPENEATWRRPLGIE